MERWGGALVAGLFYGIVDGLQDVRCQAECSWKLERIPSEIEREMKVDNKSVKVDNISPKSIIYE
ncbi:MAG: hypothetical protein ACQET6_12860 [Bacillota bacterium]